MIIRSGRSRMKIPPRAKTPITRPKTVDTIAPTTPRMAPIIPKIIPIKVPINPKMNLNIVTSAIKV
jgi:hypothetical protein